MAWRTEETVSLAGARGSRGVQIAPAGLVDTMPVLLHEMSRLLALQHVDRLLVLCTLHMASLAGGCCFLLALMPQLMAPVTESARASLPGPLDARV